jgi:hypothetical protein
MSNNTIPCVFVQTKSGVPIYGLETDEYWTKSNNGEICTQLKDLELTHTQIFIKPYILYQIHYSISEEYKKFIKMFLYVLWSKDSNLIKLKSDYFSGTNIYDFTINPEFLSTLNSDEIDAIIMNIWLGDRNLKPDEKLKIYSYNLIKQLKVMSFKTEYDLSFEYNFDTNTNEVYWQYDMFVKTYVNNPDYKNHLEKNYKYFSGCYDNIVSIQKDIIDVNYTNDKKDESENE